MMLEAFKVRHLSHFTKQRRKYIQIFKEAFQFRFTGRAIYSIVRSFYLFELPKYRILHPRVHETKLLNLVLTQPPHTRHWG